MGSGALRFTNGSAGTTYGHNERGAILSTSTFPTGAGIQVTFKTVTYHGDSRGGPAPAEVRTVRTESASSFKTVPKPRASGRSAAASRIPVRIPIRPMTG